MSYGFIYSGYTRSINDHKYDVYISKSGFTGSVTGITIVDFTINYNNINKYDVIQSSSCDLTLLMSDSDNINLFTNDIFQYKLLVKSGTTIIFNGYLNTEIWSEPYKDLNNYYVQLTFNDGLPLLKRINYIDDSNDSFYTGLTRVSTIIRKLYDKTGISLSGFKTSTDLKCSGHTGTANADYNIFSQLYQLESNFTDESNNYIDCYTVLQRILKGFRVYIYKNYMYIIDWTNTDNTTLNIRNFNNTWTYSNTTVLSNYYNISTNNSINFINSVQHLSYKPGYNKLNLIYSPFTDTNLINNTDFDDSGNWYGGSDSWTLISETSTNYSYELSQRTDIKDWKREHAYDKFYAIRDEDDQDSFLFTPVGYYGTAGYPVAFEYTGNSAYLSYADNYYLELELDIQNNNKGFYPKESYNYENQTAYYFWYAITLTDLEGNTKYLKLEYDPGTFNKVYSWTNTVTWLSYKVNDSNSQDAWYTIDPVIHNLPGGHSGYISVMLSSRFQAYKELGNTLITNGADVAYNSDLLFKDINIYISTGANNSLWGYLYQTGEKLQNNDVEVTSYLDANYQNEMKINTYAGAGYTPVDRASYRFSDGSYSNYFGYDGSNWQIFEDQLSKNMISNFALNSLQLNCDLVFNDLFSDFDPIMKIQDNHKLSGKKMLLQGCKLDVLQDEISGQFEEIQIETL